MKKIVISKETKELINEFEKLYKEKKVFTEKRMVQFNPELNELRPKLYISLAQDINAHVGITSGVGVSGRILYNYAIIVTSCSRCTCHVGIYDGSACYYLGSYDQCVEV